MTSLPSGSSSSAPARQGRTPARKVHVTLTKDQIHQAPDYEAEREREEAYRQDIGTYYGPYFYP